MSDLDDLRTEYTAVKAALASATQKSILSDGTQVVNHDYVALSNRASFLRTMINRLSGASPMIVRGVVKGFH